MDFEEGGLVTRSSRPLEWLGPRKEVPEDVVVLARSTDLADSSVYVV
jgi:hypothetical protein